MTHQREARPSISDAAEDLIPFPVHIELVKLQESDI
jgi:hypothetical protein